MKKPLFLFWLFSIVCVGAGIPYAFEVQRDVIAQSSFPLPLLVLISIVQTAVLLGVAIYLGSRAAKNIGLKVFSFQSEGVGVMPKIRNVFRVATPAGIISAAAIYIVDAIFSIVTPQMSLQTIHVTMWKTVMASFYGGVVEEVLMRLFLMSVVAFILSKIFKLMSPVQNKLLMWSAIVISAVVFGLGHLPVTAAITTITPLIVLRAIVLNGIGGLIFGWLYWRKGLEYSIVAHFTADIFLLTLIPLLVSL